jgi:hypothetical protein
MEPNIKSVRGVHLLHHANHVHLLAQQICGRTLLDIWCHANRCKYLNLVLHTTVVVCTKRTHLFAGVPSTAGADDSNGKGRSCGVRQYTVLFT